MLFSLMTLNRCFDASMHSPCQPAGGPAEQPQPPFLKPAVAWQLEAEAVPGKLTRRCAFSGKHTPGSYPSAATTTRRLLDQQEAWIRKQPQQNNTRVHICTWRTSRASHQHAQSAPLIILRCQNHTRCSRAASKGASPAAARLREPTRNKLVRCGGRRCVIAGHSSWLARMWGRCARATRAPAPEALMPSRQSWPGSRRCPVG